MLAGWRSGFIFVLLDLIGMSLSIVAALLLYSYLAVLFGGFIADPGLATVVAFMLVFFTASIIFGLISRRIYGSIPEDTRRSRVNKAFGVPLGFAKGVILSALLVLMLVALPLGINQKNVTGSMIGSYMLNLGSSIERVALSVLPQDIKEGFTFLTVKPGADKSIKIPVATNINVDARAEQEMLRLVNQERKAHGLKPLVMDTNLRSVARAHSRDMFLQGYFSHISPKDESPFDRIRDAKIRFSTAGENIAKAPTVRIAHEGLMQSPGHRENILRPTFGKVGIGTYSNTLYGKIFTQNFTN